MPVGIGAAGSIGVGFESTPGTYTAPTKFIPIRSESLKYMLDINYTRPIIKTSVDPVYAVKGPAHVEGDVELELTTDTFPYFLHMARMTVNKSGSAPDFVYTFTPAATAQEANKVASLTVVRNAEVFGYTGCVVGGMSVTVENGMLVGTMRIVGRDEADQSAPTESYLELAPLGADSLAIEIPSASPITDAGSFTFDLDDNAEAQFRLGSLAAQYVGYGERSVSAEIERDFIDKTQYDLFKALTAQSVHFRSEDPADADRYIDFLIDTANMDSYESMLEGQGDIITAALSFTGRYNFTNTRSFVIEVGSVEDIT
jgi:hypothetical protein